MVPGISHSARMPNLHTHVKADRFDAAATATVTAIATTSTQWKGRAAYFDFYPPTSPPSDKPVARSRIWTYPSPTKGTKFAPLANYYSFYASTNNRDKNGGGGGGGGEWKCFVGEEQVVPQDGDVSVSGSRKGDPLRTEAAAC